MWAEYDRFPGFPMIRALFLWSAVACRPEPEIPAPPAEADTDADTDADSDDDSDDDSGTDVGIDADGDGFPAGEDCDDADPGVYPGAPDLCGDDRVTDCARTTDDGLVTVDGAATFDTLRAALAAAPAGAEVRVCPGVHRGNFATDLPVRLIAHAGRDRTTLEGAGRRTLTLPGDSEIVGFTIRGGRSTLPGGGIRQVGGGPLSIRGCLVTGNRAESGAGIATWSDSEITLVDTVVEHNIAASDGGGISLLDRSVLDLSAGSSVSFNLAGASGGGIETASVGVVRGGLVSDNQAAYGGGIAVGTLSTVEDTRVSRNRATEGGGISARPSVGDVVLRRVTIDDNRAELGAGVGVYGWDVHAIIDACTITGNDADLAGGGVYFRGSQLFGKDTVTRGTLAIDGSTLGDNRAARGAGLYVHAGSAAITGGSWLHNLATGDGGAVWMAPLDASVSVDGADLGSGADDNLPDDVAVGEIGYLGYGSTSTFACAGDGCMPAP
jgi:hypothetical protein